MSSLYDFELDVLVKLPWKLILLLSSLELFDAAPTTAPLPSGAFDTLVSFILGTYVFLGPTLPSQCSLIWQ